MLLLPTMGFDAIFPVLIVIALVVCVIGLVHPMRALMMRKPE